jgi:hypothetical protein
LLSIRKIRWLLQSGIEYLRLAAGSKFSAIKRKSIGRGDERRGKVRIGEEERGDRKG